MGRPKPLADLTPRGRYIRRVMQERRGREFARLWNRHRPRTQFVRFSRELRAKVLDGSKTMTIRPFRIRPGIYQVCHADASIQILWVTLLHVSVLTERVARLEGFSSLEDLRAFLKGRYPGRVWFWLHEFRLLSSGALEAQGVTP